MAADANTNGRGDVLKFGKNAEGEYTTLVLPADIAAPDAGEVYLNTADTEYIFAKAYESNGKVVYRIRPSATVGISFVKNEYTGENKDKLTSLTERFWKYLQSSRAYRASVLDNEKAASGAKN